MAMPVESKSEDEVKKLLDELYESDHRLMKRPWEDWPFAANAEADRASQLAVEKFASSVYLPASPMSVSAKKIEADIVDGWLPYFSAPENASGMTTTGGSESILFAVHAAIDKAKRAGKNTLGAEILATDTAWVALEKAAQAFQLEIKRIPLDDNLTMDVEQTRAAITERTVLIFASAPCFQYGTIDDIEGLGAVARENDLWLHIDACSGGFLAPFMRRAGVDIPPWDFAVDGVSSISADQHKFGYSFPGCSTLFFRDKEDMENAVFNLGPPIMAPTPYHNLTGTRSSTGPAAAWAVMHSLGDEGFAAVAKRIADSVREICDGVTSIDGIEVYNDPKLSLVTYLLDDPEKAQHVQTQMFMEGWVLMPLLKPVGAFTMFVGSGHYGRIDSFLESLRKAVQE